MTGDSHVAPPVSPPHGAIRITLFHISLVDGRYQKATALFCSQGLSFSGAELANRKFLVLYVGQYYMSYYVLCTIICTLPHALDQTTFLSMSTFLQAKVLIYDTTVVPVMNGDPRDQAKVSVHDRWPLIGGTGGRRQT